MQSKVVRRDLAVFPGYKGLESFISEVEIKRLRVVEVVIRSVFVLVMAEQGSKKEETYDKPL